MKNNNPLQTEIFIKQEKEKDIQRRIGKILLLKNYLVIRFNSGGLFMNGHFYWFYRILNNGKNSGLPDLQFMRDNKTWFIEVKGRDGILKDSQKEFIELAQQYHIPVLVTSSWEEVLNYVESL
jgi:hypothetical protein